MCLAASPGSAAARSVASAILVLALAACDKEPAHTDAREAAAAPTASATSTSPPPPEPPRPPDIIIDQATISVGHEHLATGELNLADRVAAIVKSQPAIAGQVIDFVAMRNAKPSQVASVVSALRAAAASGANVKTESRDGNTVKLAISFSTKEPDCVAAAWITKEGAIDVWPVGGAVAKRINKGLAGPDMTLGTEAVLGIAGSCAASELIVGGDDHFPWGLVFDLATSATTAHGSRTNAVILTTTAVPGRKVKLD
jgi:hypothetical protein